MQGRLELKGIDRKSTNLYSKDVHEVKRSQNPVHIFHEDMGKLKAVKGENPWCVVILKAA